MREQQRIDPNEAAVGIVTGIGTVVEALQPPEADTLEGLELSI